MSTSFFLKQKFFSEHIFSYFVICVISMFQTHKQQLGKYSNFYSDLQHCSKYVEGMIGVTIINPN